MGNSKNKKVYKKRKPPNKSKCKNSSHQKENVPKNVKTRATKPKPSDGIEMSKQLLVKKTRVRTQRLSSSKPVKMCPNGKPLPSLAELQKMYEDSDDDHESPKNPTQKPTYTSSTPQKQTLNRDSEKNLLSPSKINEITERLLGSITKQNLPDPSELLEATALFRPKSPPPPPIIPPKKRKKTEIPYIVGCKDRPKIMSKPNANFCKGDDYGIKPSSDTEEETPTKRAKKSRIPKYSKSIFNAHSDEIAERLTKDDAGGLSDASSDSNKTIEYYPTSCIFKNPRPHTFSPLPSTSTDTKTIRKNDDLFNESLERNESLKKINLESTLEITEEDLPITKLSTPKIKHDCLITKKATPKKDDDFLITKAKLKKVDDFLITKKATLKKDDDFLITKEATPKKYDDFLTTKEATPKKDDDFLITKKATPKKDDDFLKETTLKKKDDFLIRQIDLLVNGQTSGQKKEDDVQMIDIPHETIVIEDIYERTIIRRRKPQASNTRHIDTNDIEIIETAESEMVKPKEKNIILSIPNEEDCIIVPSSETINNHNNSKLNEPIVIDDDYSTINMEFDSSNNEPIEIIDVDDIIAENKCILDKWKNCGASALGKINTVVDVPTTYKNGTVVQQTTVTSSTSLPKTVTGSTTVQTIVTPSTTVQTIVTPSTTEQPIVTPRTRVQPIVTPSTRGQTIVTPSTRVQSIVTPSTSVRPIVTQSTTVRPTVTPSTRVQPIVTPSTTVQPIVTPSTTVQTIVTPSTRVRPTVTPSTTVQPIVTPSTRVRPTVTPSTTVQPIVTPSTIVQTPSTSSSALQASVTPRTTPNTSSPLNHNNNLNITNRSTATNLRSTDYFRSPQNTRTINPEAIETGIESLMDYVVHTLAESRSTGNRNKRKSFSVISVLPLSPNASQSTSNRQQQYDNVQVYNSRSLCGQQAQQTSTTIPSRNIGDCPICLDPLNSSNGIASTICGHVFCLTCIQASVRTNGRKCPTCRKTLKGSGGGYHQLYL